MTMPELSFHRVTGVAIQATPRNNDPKNGSNNHHSRTILIQQPAGEDFEIVLYSDDPDTLLIKELDL